MKCIRCNKQIPDLAVEAHDPYCSTECARKAYGTFKGSRTEEKSQQEIDKLLPVRA